jgi:hypothetical protein
MGLSAIADVARAQIRANFQGESCKTGQNVVKRSRLVKD